MQLLHHSPHARRQSQPGCVGHLRKRGQLISDGVKELNLKFPGLDLLVLLPAVQPQPQHCVPEKFMPLGQGGAAAG